MKVFRAGEITTKQDVIFKKLYRLLSENSKQEKAEALIKQIAQLRENDKIRVAFVGQYSAGKSSMIAALTKEDIAIGTDVTTQKSTDYEWGSVLLTDTPGLQNSQEHDEIATEAIKNADLIIYCITCELFSRNTLADYLSLAYDKGYYNKMILVVNKVNSEATDNQAKLIETYKKSLNKMLEPHSIEDVPYCFIDVLDYMDGLEDDDEELLEDSNFETFITTLNEELSKNGAIYKLDTPLKAALDTISTVITDESETLEERQQNDILSRLEREFLAMRSDAGRAWENEVKLCVNNFIPAAHDLYDQATNGEVSDFNFEFQTLLDDTIDELNANLNKLVLNQENDCVEKASGILTSRTAQRAFGGIGTASSRSHSIRSSISLGAGTSLLTEKLSGLTRSFLSNLSLDTGSIKNVVLDVGHTFGKKFKPWGAAKIAKGIGTVLDNLGPAIDIASVFMDLRSAKKEEEASNEAKKQRDDYYALLTDIKKSMFDACKQSKEEALYPIFNSRIDELNAIRHNIQESKATISKLNRDLNALKKEITEIQKLLYPEFTELE